MNKITKVPKLRFPKFTDEWEQRKLSDEFSNFIVPMRDKPKEFGGNIPWTRIEDIEGKYLNGSLSGQYVTEETVKKMNLKIIPKDSLIVSSSATFGVVAVVTNDLITNQTFIADEMIYTYPKKRLAGIIVVLAALPVVAILSIINKGYGYGIGMIAFMIYVSYLTFAQKKSYYRFTTSKSV